MGRQLTWRKAANLSTKNDGMNERAKHPVKGDLIGTCLLVVAFGVVGILLHTHRVEFASKAKLQETLALVRRDIAQAESARQWIASARASKPRQERKKTETSQEYQVRLATFKRDAAIYSQMEGRLKQLPPTEEARC